MKKLTEENIEFIEHYLKKTGIKYTDIKLEILDHVATGIELKMNEEHKTFYDAFREYMIENKKNIIDWNENELKKATGTVLDRFIKSLLAIDTLLITALFVIILCQVDSELVTKSLVQNIPFRTTLIFSVVALLLYYKERRLILVTRLFYLSLFIFYGGVYSVLAPFLIIVVMYSVKREIKLAYIQTIILLLVFSVLFILEAKYKALIEYWFVALILHFITVYVSFKTLFSFKKTLNKKHRQIKALTS
ncbi:MAG: hypothetical protein HRT68_11780 [Flavobacteriaceae bacterium]|nr:hypothetical protein [Flavobacteriaceae bacterium]